MATGHKNIIQMNGADIRNLRIKLGLSQTEFWTRVAVSQSAGSRYEKGLRELPYSEKTMIELVFGNRPDRVLNRLRHGEWFKHLVPKTMR